MSFNHSNQFYEDVIPNISEVEELAPPSPWEENQPETIQFVPRAAQMTFQVTDWTVGMELESEEDVDTPRTFGRNIREEFEDVEDLIELDRNQEILQEQIRALESAHAQLESARMELVMILMSQLGRPSHDTPELEELEDDNEEDEIDDEKEDEHEHEDEEFFHHVITRDAEPLFHPFDIGEGSDDQFLDANGVICVGFVECLEKAVGWTGQTNGPSEYGLDANGNISNEILIPPFR